MASTRIELAMLRYLLRPSWAFDLGCIINRQLISEIASHFGPFGLMFFLPARRSCESENKASMDVQFKLSAKTEKTLAR